MYVKLSCLAAIAVALLPSSVVGRGKKIPFGRDVQLLAELGIEPDLDRHEYASIHSAVSHSAMVTIKDEYVSVRVAEVLCRWYGSNVRRSRSITTTHRQVHTETDSG